MINPSSRLYISSFVRLLVTLDKNGYQRLTSALSVNEEDSEQDLNEAIDKALKECDLRGRFDEVYADVFDQYREATKGTPPTGRASTESMTEIKNSLIQCSTTTEVDESIEALKKLDKKINDLRREDNGDS